MLKNFYDKETRQPWCVRLHPDQTVEFYDARHEHTDYGQFVSRYNVHTIMGHTPGVGLNLNGAIASWSISGKTMNRIVRWLNEVVEVQL